MPSHTGNWLSQREALPPAYETAGLRVRVEASVTTGFRLPTEAEWEYAAATQAPDCCGALPGETSFPSRPR